jgi:hypothetical protein
MLAQAVPVDELRIGAEVMIFRTIRHPARSRRLALGSGCEDALAGSASVFVTLDAIRIIVR